MKAEIIVGELIAVDLDTKKLKLRAYPALRIDNLKTFRVKGKSFVLDGDNKSVIDYKGAIGEIGYDTSIDAEDFLSFGSDFLSLIKGLDELESKITKLLGKDVEIFTIEDTLIHIMEYDPSRFRVIDIKETSDWEELL